MLQDTKLSLRTWFLAAYLLDTDRRSTTVAGLARILGVGPEAARSVRDRIALALASPGGRRMFGLMREEVREREREPHVMRH
ncbi:MAG: hypothetical protein KY455_12575 [Euryarchaeota archaeon]|nr:hypothetical protein [Euryarchaeota archaeon]